jgi:hypothetical protein
MFHINWPDHHKNTEALQVTSINVLAAVSPSSFLGTTLRQWVIRF